uniref:Phosphatidylserine decarboxylase n=1 Tax=Mus musculus TaxID=10090 RepID=D6RIN9_MOUSE
MAASGGRACVRSLRGGVLWRSRCQKFPYCSCPILVPAAPCAHPVGNRWRVCRVPAV